ncbi:hypothetical protein RBL05_11180 [Brachybacterium sp. GU-2]|nr:hypothetical protein [Brachybacterium sp. GU-2]WME22096.2 hypothetical protein RBL05_11180 [Brachybacterium sp. GU-2]
MAHGDGSFYQDERGYWVAIVNLPKGPDGKRRRKVIRRPKKSDVVSERLKILGELANHGDVITVTPTIKAWCDSWLKDTAPERLRPRTLDTYAGYINRWIIPAIGRVKLADLTPRHVEAVQQLCRDGYGEGKDRKDPVSSTTRLQIHRILAVVLRDAVRAGHLRTNPADRDHVAAPKRRHVETNVLTGAQTRALLEAVAEHPLAARWALALFTGMRQGECLGIERAAVDLERDLITVRWQAQKLKAGAKPDESIPQRDLGRGYWLLPRRPAAPSASSPSSSRCTSPSRRTCRRCPTPPRSTISCSGARTACPWIRRRTATPGRPSSPPPSCHRCACTMRATASPRCSSRPAWTSTSSRRSSATPPSLRRRGMRT